MMRISDVVQQALTSGYLSVRAENQLRLLLKAKDDSKELNASMTLQLAAIEECV